MKQKKNKRVEVALVCEKGISEIEVISNLSIPHITKQY
jgi:hypothetical protein